MNVLIVQTQMKGYRRPLFEHLAASLAVANIRLSVAYGGASAVEASKRDQVDLDEVGIVVKNTWLLNGRLLYQKVWPHVAKSDLVVVEHANKNLINYALMAASAAGRRRVAFWGHGRNMQRRPTTLAERWKRRTLRLCDWWFAYTSGCAEYLVQNGVNADRITVVQNAVDTETFSAQVGAVSPHEVASLRGELDFSTDARVGLYCGALYAEKCIPFLIEAGRRAFQRDRRFRLVICGDGPLRDVAQRAASCEEWLRYVGPVFGETKARYFALAELMLCPGGVGLAILDGFAAALPMLTTENHWHGPEVEYLVDGSNGLVLPYDEGAYAAAIVRLLQDGQAMARLNDGAVTAGRRYTLASMVANFSDGIQASLR